MRNDLNVPYEGINFSVTAVTDMSRDEWVAMASNQYFDTLEKVGREQKCGEVYDLCIQLKKDNQPKHEPAEDDPLADNTSLPDVGRKNRVNTRKSVKASDEEAANTNNG